MGFGLAIVGWRRERAKVGREKYPNLVGLAAKHIHGPLQLWLLDFGEDRIPKVGGVKKRGLR